jgi:hypothetical protein
MEFTENAKGSVTINQTAQVIRFTVSNFWVDIFGTPGWGEIMGALPLYNLDYNVVSKTAFTIYGTTPVTLWNETWTGTWTKQ